MKILYSISALLILCMPISLKAATAIQKNWEMNKESALDNGINISVKQVDYLCGGQPEITINIPNTFKKRKFKASGFTVFQDDVLLVSSGLPSGKLDESNNEVFFCLSQALLFSAQVEIHYGIGEHITDTVILKNMATYAN